MSKSFAIKAAAGALALAVSAAASAQTVGTGTNGTIFVNVVDSATGATFSFDTGIATSSLNGTSSGTSQNWNLASLSATSSNWSSFITAAGSDSLEYSVTGAYTNSTGNLTSDMTATSTPVVTTGQRANAVGNAIGQYAGGALIPLGGSVYINAANAGTLGWLATGEGVSSTLAAGVADLNTVTASASADQMNFYTIAATVNSTRSGGSTSTVAGTWSLTSAGLLQYTSAVPLPTPLVLMLSGLGLMGIVSRRKIAA